MLPPLKYGYLLKAYGKFDSSLGEPSGFRFIRIEKSEIRKNRVFLPFTISRLKLLHYGCLWTSLGPTRSPVPVPRYFSVLLRYFNLILKGLKEPSEPERAIARRSGELVKIRRVWIYLVKPGNARFCITTMPLTLNQVGNEKENLH